MDLNTVVSLVGVVVLLLWKTGVFSKLGTAISHDPLGGVKAAASVVEAAKGVVSNATTHHVVLPTLPTDFIDTVQTYKKLLDSKVAEYQDFISKLKGLQ